MKKATNATNGSIESTKDKMFILGKLIGMIWPEQAEFHGFTNRQLFVIAVIAVAIVTFLVVLANS
jgi:hypothetical protein